MGTNYYLEDTCHHCKHTRRLHIGKSSCGWVFSLHVFPDNKLDGHPMLDGELIPPANLSDWLRLFESIDMRSKPEARSVQIRSEYGSEMTPLEMVAVIVCRKAVSKAISPGQCDRRSFVYDETVGLWRAILSEPYLHARGSGTWDELTGNEDSW